MHMIRKSAGPAAGPSWVDLRAHAWLQLGHGTRLPVFRLGESDSDSESGPGSDRVRRVVTAAAHVRVLVL